MRDNWIPAIAIAVIATAVVLALVWFSSLLDYREYRMPCEDMGSIAQRNIPARCVGYWAGKQD